jgi:hypothetical protein
VNTGIVVAVAETGMNPDLNPDLSPVTFDVAAFMFDVTESIGVQGELKLDCTTEWFYIAVSRPSSPRISRAALSHLRVELKLNHLTGIHLQVVGLKCQGPIRADLDDMDFNLTSWGSSRCLTRNFRRQNRGGEKKRRRDKVGKVHDVVIVNINNVKKVLKGSTKTL